MTLGTKLTVVWLVFSGLIHLLVEGTWAFFLTKSEIPKAPGRFFFTSPAAYWVDSGDVLSDVWQWWLRLQYNCWEEYSHADARYLQERDSFVWPMEAFTAVFDGLLCLAAAWAVARRLSWRHPAVIVVSVCQWYGCVLYFLTEWAEGFRNVDWTDPLYYVWYFGVLNGVWIVVPMVLVLSAWADISRAFSGGGGQGLGKGKGKGKKAKTQ